MFLGRYVAGRADELFRDNAYARSLTTYTPHQSHVEAAVTYPMLNASDLAIRPAENTTASDRVEASSPALHTYCTKPNYVNRVAMLGKPIHQYASYSGFDGA